VTPFNIHLARKLLSNTNLIMHVPCNMLNQIKASAVSKILAPFTDIHTLLLCLLLKDAASVFLIKLLPVTV